MKTICFDLDGTLCSNTFGDYESAEPFPWAIERVNALAAAGHRLVIFTARGTATGIDWSDVTRAQLARWNVAYDELRLGKPNADVFVDDRAVHTDSWRLSHLGSAPGFALPPVGEGEGLPHLPPPHTSAIAETGRTFGGRPLWLREHADRARARSRAAGIRAVPTADSVERAALEALESAGPAPQDTVFTISIWDAADASHLDSLGTGTGVGLHVACRRLEQPAAHLARIAIGEWAGTPLVRASTDARAAGTSWLLACDEDGHVADALGGHLIVASGDRVAIEAEHADELPSLAHVIAALGAEVRPIDAGELRGADEVLVTGLPFGVVAIGAVDGLPLGERPGRVAARLAQIWSEAVGIDVARQAITAAGAPTTLETETTNAR